MRFLSFLFLFFCLAGPLWAGEGLSPDEALLLTAEAEAVPSHSEKRPARNLAGDLKSFLGAPFRVDGALNLKGQWVTFNQPDIPADSAGFNCSGFTVAAARRLLCRDFDLTEVSYDRAGDSGEGAVFGQDWDFGLDIILNLAQDYPHRLLPEVDLSKPPFESMASGRAMGLGVSLHSPDFEKQLAQIQPGNFCFFVFSKPDRRFPVGVSYYHVGVIVPDGSALWLYHSTAGAKTNRVNLADPEGLARLRRHFKPLANAERRVLMIEVTPPETCR